LGPTERANPNAASYEAFRAVFQYMDLGSEVFNSERGLTDLPQSPQENAEIALK
jgi:hypothetical protein